MVAGDDIFSMSTVSEVDRDLRARFPFDHENAPGGRVPPRKKTRFLGGANHLDEPGRFLQEMHAARRTAPLHPRQLPSIQVYKMQLLQASHLSPPAHQRQEL
jgi:hypothetical protein